MRRSLVLLAMLFAPLLVGCALNPPRIVSIAPGREVTDVPSNQTISITFDRPMDHQSVEDRFELSPSLAGCSGTRDCRFAWTGNTFMFLHPKVNFTLSTEYTVSMQAGYADSSGQRNTLDHVWHFTTERPPRLASIDPPDNAASVAPDRNILLSFSRPMRSDSMRGAVQLTPDVPFVLRGKPAGDGSQYEIVPTIVLPPNQSYTVSLGRPIDIHGNRLETSFQSRFKTGSLSLNRKVGYLMAQPGQPAFAVGIVDPHADSFLGRSTPKTIYQLSQQSQATDALLGFDWSPDGQRLVVVQGPKNGSSGPIQIVDVPSGTVIRPGISGSAVYWAADGSIVYLQSGVLHRFKPGTLQDVALTDPADGPVIAPLALSPDGRSVAYNTTDAAGVSHLWIMNMELKSRYRPVGLDDPADHPSWSPNGTKLAFRRITATGPELWVYDLTPNGGPSYRRVGALDITGTTWLNDNSTVIAATGSGSAATLYRINIFSVGEAGGLVKVTGSKEAPNGALPNSPLYDRRVAFVGEVDQLPQIFLMNGDGSRPQQLTEWEADYPFTGTAANWTPVG